MASGGHKLQATLLPLNNAVQIAHNATEGIYALGVDSTFTIPITTVTDCACFSDVVTGLVAKADPNRLAASP